MLTRTPAVLIGQAIGDSLGMPFETLGDEVHPDLANWEGEYRHGTFLDLPPGHFTDDTEMAECLATSLVERGMYDGADVARRYLAWSKGTPHGMGGSTRVAMKKLDSGLSSWRDSGVPFASPHLVGSAPAMRAAPIGAFYPAGYRLSVIHETCVHDAQITHMDREAWASSFAVVLAVRAMLQDHDPTSVCAEIVDELSRHGPATLVEAALHRASQTLRCHDVRVFMRTTSASPSNFLLEAPSSFAQRNAGVRGNAWQITATAIYCALWAPSYREGIMAAIKLGGDTDTRGAIAGAIMGARFGLEGIPLEYMRGLLDFDRLHTLDRWLPQTFGKPR